MDQTQEPKLDSATSPVALLPSECQRVLQGLRVEKAQMELTEATVKVQILKEQLEEARHNNLAAQMQVLPHRALPLKIYNDGLSWIAKYECPEGEPLVGRGEAPQRALTDFDHQWLGMK